MNGVLFSGGPEHADVRRAECLAFLRKHLAAMEALPSDRVLITGVSAGVVAAGIRKLLDADAGKSTACVFEPPLVMLEHPFSGAALIEVLSGDQSLPRPIVDGWRLGIPDGPTQDFICGECGLHIRFNFVLTAGTVQCCCGRGMLPTIDVAGES